MYRITVINRQGYVVAVYHNEDPEQGREIARMEHGENVEIRVERE